MSGAGREPTNEKARDDYGPLMEIEFLGGTREIGRSAILVNDSLLLDYGMATGNPPSFPVGDPDPEAVVVSHGHLDHVGAVPSLLSGDARPPIHWTPPTRDLTRVLAEDTLKLHGGTYDCPFTEAECKRLSQVSETHGYRESFAAAGHEVTLFDAGHIPGSAHVLVDDGDTRLLYTGDFHTDDQQLLSGTTASPEADVVVTESTYSDVIHDPREGVERAFAESVKTTLWEGHRDRARVRPMANAGAAHGLCDPRHRLLRRRHGNGGHSDRPSVPRLRPGRRGAPAREIERPVRDGTRRSAQADRRPEHRRRHHLGDARKRRFASIRRFLTAKAKLTQNSRF